MTNNTIKKSISIIVPVFNEEANIRMIVSRITQSITRMDRYSSQIIFIDDGSTDQSFLMMKEAAQNDNRFKAISFSRNFGHQSAISAGLTLSNTDLIAVIDADGQDPPEIIPEMVNIIESGSDVVYGVRKKRKEGFMKRISYLAFYRILRIISDINIPLDSGDFCVMTNSVSKIIQELPEKNRFIRGLRAWSGFRQTAYQYERESRQAGKTKYGLFKLLKLAADGIFAFSTFPLRIASLIGLLFWALSLIGIIIVFYYKLFLGINLAGWSSLIVVILFVNGLQFLILGLIGEYIGRIYIETKSRKLYVIKERMNI